MVDSMWSAVKGPVESGPICDKYVQMKLISCSQDNFIFGDHFFLLLICMVHLVWSMFYQVWRKLDAFHYKA